MKVARVFVSPSRFEGHPNVVLEAIACGTSLIVSDIPEHREFLDPSCAVLVSPDDVTGLTAAIEAALSDPESFRGGPGPRSHGSRVSRSTTPLPCLRCGVPRHREEAIGMCGIVGVVHARLAPRAAAPIDQMRDTLRHRGPDDEGSWWSPDGRVALGFRRLSILDLSPLGHQPMASHDGSCQVIFNGEIYNFAHLRQELSSKGHSFRSGSDTEVLLAAYLEWGAEFSPATAGDVCLCAVRCARPDASGRPRPGGREATVHLAGARATRLRLRTQGDSPMAGGSAAPGSTGAGVLPGVRLCAWRPLSSRGGAEAPAGARHALRARYRYGSCLAILAATRGWGGPPGRDGEAG